MSSTAGVSSFKCRVTVTLEARARVEVQRILGAPAVRTSPDRGPNTAGLAHATAWTIHTADLSTVSNAIGASRTITCHTISTRQVAKARRTLARLSIADPVFWAGAAGSTAGSRLLTWIAFRTIRLANGGLDCALGTGRAYLTTRDRRVSTRGTIKAAVLTS